MTEKFGIYHAGLRLPDTLGADTDYSCDDVESVDKTKQVFVELYELLKSRNDAWLIFDLDGVLVQGAIETPAVGGRVEEYIEDHKEAVTKFKKRLTSLKAAGFHVGINTGRGAEFTKKVAETIFPFGSVDEIICESGAQIVTPKISKSDPAKLDYDYRRPDCVSEEGVQLLKQHRNSIIEFARTLGADEEPGSKEVLLSLSPPLLKIEGFQTSQEINVIKQSEMAIFYNQVKQFIDTEIGSGILEITHSQSAVDISPKGVDKLMAMQEVVGSNAHESQKVIAYFGDAKGDIVAMRGSAINITPGNATDECKEVAKEATLGIVAPEECVEIEGIAGALKIIDVYLKIAKRLARGAITETSENPNY